MREAYTDTKNKRAEGWDEKDRERERKATFSHFVFVRPEILCFVFMILIQIGSVWCCYAYQCICNPSSKQKNNNPKRILFSYLILHSFFPIAFRNNNWISFFCHRNSWKKILPTCILAHLFRLLYWFIETIFIILISIIITTVSSVISITNIVNIDKIILMKIILLSVIFLS